MMTLIKFIDGDPHRLDDDGKATGQTFFYCKSTDCTFSGDVITNFPHMENARNADPIYLIDTCQVFMFDEDSMTGLPQKV